MLKIPPEDERDRARFDKYWVEDPSGCHRWIGFERSKGYGGFQIGYSTYRAHRVAYAWAHGEPGATDVHHDCGNRWCVNPDHMSAVTEDHPRPYHRGPYQDECAHGHEFTPENTYVNPRGERQCRVCLRAAVKRHRDANRDAILAKRRAQREHLVYDPRPCLQCGEVYEPKYKNARFCARRECLNARQRLNRLKRLGRA